ncbi:MAG: DUF4003 family protein [Clostridia bacterium]|nr:DUF4003 family protein [Clostridia bacterium]
MNDEIVTRTELFFENVSAFNEAMRFRGNVMPGIASAYIASAGIRVGAADIKRCYDVLKDMNGVLSYARGEMAPVMVAAMIRDGDIFSIERYNEAYAALKRQLKANQFTALCAVLLACSKGNEEFESVSAAAREQYECFRRKHGFRTFIMDGMNYVISAIDGCDPEEKAERAEEFFRLSRSVHRLRLPWSSAQILALKDGDTAAKCSDAVELKGRIKEYVRGASFYYELGGVWLDPSGTLEKLDDIISVRDILNEDKRFKKWRMFEDVRLAIANLIVHPDRDMFFIAASGSLKRTQNNNSAVTGAVIATS